MHLPARRFFCSTYLDIASYLLFSYQNFQALHHCRIDPVKDFHHGDLNASSDHAQSFAKYFL